MRKSEQQEHLKTFAGIPLSAEVRDVRQHPDTVEPVVDRDEPRGDGHACPSCGSTWCVTKDSGATSSALRRGTMRRPISTCFQETTARVRSHDTTTKGGDAISKKKDISDVLRSTLGWGLPAAL